MSFRKTETYKKWKF